MKNSMCKLGSAIAAVILLTGCAVGVAELNTRIVLEDRQVYVVQQYHQVRAFSLDIDETEMLSEGAFPELYDVVLQGLGEAFGPERIHMLGDTKEPQDIDVFSGQGSVEYGPYVGDVIVGVQVLADYGRDLERDRYRLDLHASMFFAEAVDGRFGAHPSPMGHAPTGLGSVKGPLIPGDVPITLAAFLAAAPPADLRAELADSARVEMRKWLEQYRAAGGQP